ncbi:MAG: hypothetical protein EXR17_02780 [Flavobacteriaceae bacterium]|nr:hypothetical protein [Flavobacteriaceae bacterium]
MKLKHILFALIYPLATFLGSCGSETKPKPKISLVAGTKYVSASISVMSDSMLTFSIKTVAGSDNMANISASYSLNGGVAKTFFDTSVAGKEVVCIIKNRISAGVDDILDYTFTATDANAEKASTSIKIFVIPPTVPLTGVAGQIIYNARNVGFDNAYNLNTAIAFKSTNGNFAISDILDKTPTGAEQFAKTWGSGNESKFVRVTSNDFTNAQTTTFLYNLWKANGAKATLEINDIKKGDIILVKSGQAIPFNLYILKITNIQDLPALGNHNDYIMFDYRMID